MPSPNVARAFLNQYKPPHNTGSEASTVPVAVFVGGTAGIGASIASELTQALKGDIDVFIVGRNVAAGQAVLDSLPSSTNTLQRIRKFVQCDATLMRDVIRAAHEIKAKAERINYLAMSQGMLSLQGRTESTEGIDAKLALHYYSRWKFTHELLPLIQKAKDDGQDAKVMTVLAAGHGGKINTDDLGLKQTYSVTNAGLQGPSYNDCMIQSFAEHHPTLSFIHAYPGLVRTSLASSSNSLALRLFSPVMTGLTYAIGTSAADCGARLTYGMLRSPAGWSRLNDKGEDIGDKSCFADEGTNAKLWEHTAQITAVL